MHFGEFSAGFGRFPWLDGERKTGLLVAVVFPDLWILALLVCERTLVKREKRPVRLEITNFFKKFSKKALTNSLEKAKLKLVQELEIPNSFV